MMTGGGQSFGSGTPRVFAPPYGGSSYFGQAYNWQQVLHYKHWAFIAIKAWIRQIAGGDPPNFGRIKRRTSKVKAVRKALGGPREHEEFEAYDDDHPLQRLFHNPNKPDVAYDLWAYTTLFKMLTGKVHWWLIRNSFGVPVEIWVIPTHWAYLESGRDGQPVRYRVQSPFGITQYAPFEDVVTFYDHSPLNRYEGHAVSLAIAEWLDAYESNVKARLAQYKNGAIPAFHVALGEFYADPDDGFLDRFYANWNRRFLGEDNTGRPLVTGPDIEVKSLGISPVDMRYIENEDQFAKMTLRAYGVPDAVAGLSSDSSREAWKAALASFFVFAVNPDLVYMGQVITEKIVKPVDKDGVCFWHERVMDDPEAESKRLMDEFDKGLITANEYRTTTGREPYPKGGDDPLVGGSPQPWVTGKEADPELQKQLDGPNRTSEVFDKVDTSPPFDYDSVSESNFQEERAVDPRTVIATQDHLNPQHVKDVDPDSYVKLVRAGGQLYAYDGHHKLARAIREERPSVRALIANKALTGATGAFGGYLLPPANRIKKQLPAPHPFTVAIDLDNTLAEYDGFSPLILPPKAGAKEACEAMVADGWTLLVHTARTDQLGVEAWLKEHGIPISEVHCGKPKADAYVDDRGLHFEDWAQATLELRQRARKHCKSLWTSKNGVAHHA